MENGLVLVTQQQPQSEPNMALAKTVQFCFYSHNSLPSKGKPSVLTERQRAQVSPKLKSVFYLTIIEAELRMLGGHLSLLCPLMDCSFSSPL